MYQYLDRPVSGLAEGERVMVWAMRRWLDARRDGDCPLQPVGAMFAARRLLPALAPLDAAMTLLARHARQTLVFAPLRCRRVAEGEALLLGLLGGVLRESPGRSLTTASLIVGEAHADALVETLGRLAGAFAGAGLAPVQTSRLM